MRKVLALAVSAPLVLIGAALPDFADQDYEVAAVPAETAPAPVSYRPCRPGPGDDNCIQLYERGIRASYASWRRERGVAEPRTEVAMGGPAEPRARRPRRQAVAEHCVEPAAPADEARGM